MVLPDPPRALLPAPLGPNLSYALPTRGFMYIYVYRVFSHISKAVSHSFQVNEFNLNKRKIPK